MQESCLFRHDEQCIAANDITAALAKLGVAFNDVIFVHADIGVFGKLGEDYDRTSLARTLIDALEASIPKGTLVMPTFTYAFCKDGFFDLQESPSEVGMLTEFFRHEDRVIRSQHPIFSVAARGPAARIMTNVNMDSFGEQSFFAKLREANGLIIFLGASFERATFAHYIEQMHGVPYRFKKTFKGVLREEGREQEISSMYLVRYLDRDVETYLARLEKTLKKEGALKEMAVGAGKILAVRAQDMFTAGMHMLDQDINAFLKNPPKGYDS